MIKENIRARRLWRRALFLDTARASLLEFSRIQPLPALSALQDS